MYAYAWKLSINFLFWQILHSKSAHSLHVIVTLRYVNHLFEFASISPHLKSS